ncbi:hypothetical protein SEMRO_155_G070440.1 [Seminavis robusta]|uniref:Uncharacterized protein n=1 Tax=Seminavis robusta TaxID=568900 RepID=A0A9N8DM45_9STRA|nr:hypothetical protein SEMRO_155_G070440.1 [Seminavis robusta]|eukprot:Sro155_g070440.1 n/a (272) ;mRNA; f:40956-41771
MNIPVNGVDGGRPSNRELLVEKLRIRRLMLDCVKRIQLEREYVVAAGAAPLSWYLIDQREAEGQRLAEMPDPGLWNKVNIFVCRTPGRTVNSFGQFIGDFIGKAISRGYFIEELKHVHQRKQYRMGNDEQTVKTQMKIYGLHSPLEFIQCPGGMYIDDVLATFELDVSRVMYEFYSDTLSTLYDDAIESSITTLHPSIWTTARKDVVSNSEKRKLLSALRRMSKYESFGFYVHNAAIAREVIQQCFDRANRVEEEGVGVLTIPEVSEDEDM